MNEYIQMNNQVGINTQKELQHALSPAHRHLVRAASSRWHILTIRANISSSHRHVRPSPIRAASITAQNQHRRRTINHGARHTIQREARNRNPVGDGSFVVVVLANHNSIVGDVGERDVFVSDARDGAGVAGDGLDADSVL